MCGDVLALPASLELLGGWCSLTTAGSALRACRVASPGPSWTSGRAAQALAEEWEASGRPVSFVLLLRSAFIFMPYFLLPGPGFSPWQTFLPI